MFRIMPGIEDGPVQRTFQNVKTAIAPALLMQGSAFAVDAVTALGELALPVKVPFYWTKGALSAEFSVIAQGTSFTAHVMGVKSGAAPVDILTKVCTVPAGPKIYHRFTASVSDVDLRAYDGIVISHEVPIAPAAADRYVITTQLTFEPLRTT